MASCPGVGTGGSDADRDRWQVHDFFGRTVYVLFSSPSCLMIVLGQEVLSCWCAFR